MNETNYTTDDLEFWSDPHEIYYKIYLAYDENRKLTKYRLIEEDGWDEFHNVSILEDASLEHIFIVLDLLGVKDKLVDREKWEYSLQP